MKKAIHLITCLMVLAGILSSSQIYVPAAESDVPTAVDISEELTAKSAILIDAKSGEIIFEKASHDKRPPASVTKVMTMLLAMEAIDQGKLSYDDKVTITQEASKLEGTKMFLEVGEVRTIRELLYGIAVESANDAATAIGVHIGGTLSNFIDMMNSRAKELGMDDTNFVTACGLHDENHYSSAYDIALMSKELLKHEEILDFTNTWMIDIYVGRNNETKRTLANTNKLVSKKDYVDGLKTGYTSISGHCISLTGKVGDLRLISVVMNSENSQKRFDDADKLLNYGFSLYSANYPIRTNDIIAKAHVFNAKDQAMEITVDQDIYKLTKKTDTLEFTIATEIDEGELVAPIKKGTKIGTVVIKYGDEVIGSTNAICAADVEKCGLFEYFKRIVPEFF